MVSDAVHKYVIHLLAGVIGKDSYDIVPLGRKTTGETFQSVAYLALYLCEKRIEFVNLSKENGVTYKEAIELLLRNKISSAKQKDLLPANMLMRQWEGFQELKGGSNHLTALLGICRGKRTNALQAVFYFPKGVAAREVLMEFQAIAKAAR